LIDVVDMDEMIVSGLFDAGASINTLASEPLFYLQSPSIHRLARRAALKLAYRVRQPSM
jgi:hypothetical protein